MTVREREKESDREREWAGDIFVHRMLWLLTEVVSFVCLLIAYFDFLFIHSIQFKLLYYY